jgi:hypothetical protein
MLCMIDNWRSINGVFEDMSDPQSRGSSERQSKRKKICFSGKPVWPWIILYNASFGMLAAIWVFYYLHKTRECYYELKDHWDA